MPPDNTARKEFASLWLLYLWGSLFALALPIIAFALAVSTGSLQAICGLGIFSICILQAFYTMTWRAFSDGQIASKNAGLPEPPEFARFRGFIFVILGVMSGVAKLIAAFPVFIASGHFQSLQAAFSTWNWKDVFVLAAPLMLAFFAQLKGHTLDNPGKIGKASMFLSTFSISSSTLILLCAFWGKNALLDANSIIAFPSTDTFFGIPIILPIDILSPQRQSAALDLYHVIGKTAFFALFFALPIYWLVFGIVGWLARRTRGQTPFFAKALGALPQSGFAGFFVLLLTFTVLYRTGDIKVGNQIDQELVECLSRSGGPQADLSLGCYNTAANQWETERKRKTELIIGRLDDSPRGKPAFRKLNDAWASWQQTDLAALAKKYGSDRRGVFLVSEERVRTGRDRVAYLDNVLSQQPR
jgi:hypothetical protein